MYSKYNAVCVVHYIVCAARQLCQHVMFDVCVTVCFTSQFYYAYHQLDQVCLQNVYVGKALGIVFTGHIPNRQC